jgi:hypothetical protein
MNLVNLKYCPSWPGGVARSAGVVGRALKWIEILQYIGVEARLHPGKENSVSMEKHFS